jgi:hypothetical protein
MAWRLNWAVFKAVDLLKVGELNAIQCSFRQCGDVLYAAVARAGIPKMNTECW